MAERIVGQFKEETFEVIEQEPGRLLDVPGIGMDRAGKITAAWQEQKQVKEIMVFLHSHGVSTNLAVNIYKTYGDASLETVQKNPYQLERDIYGVGFKTTDRIAQALGLPPEHPARIEAGIVFALNELINDGNVYAPREMLTRLNPASDKKAERRLFGVTYRAGDKVMQTLNNYDKDVFNGDIGFIHSLDAIDHTLTVDFDGRLVSYDWNEVDELSLACAISVHKAQGSEFPAVVLPLVPAHYMMLQRNLLYTDVTRARSLCVLVGSRKAISMAARNNKVAQRFSALERRLGKD